MGFLSQLTSSAPIATIVAAIIASIIIFLTTLYSARRSAKIELAKFRLDWIEKLRDDLSEFQSMAMLPNFKPHEEQRFYQLGTRIELRLNPDEADHKKLIKIMYEMLGVSEGSIIDKYSTNPIFVSLAQSIIRQEWKQVRKDIGGIL